MQNRTYLLTALLFSFFLPLKGNAYPQVEMQACLNNAIQSVMMKGLSVTASQIKNYCHCSLKGIIDEGKDINKTLQYCNLRYIK